jgi:hypothetical protein
MTQIRTSGHYPEPWLVPQSLRGLYRFVLGRPMDNVIRTNSTFWHRASSGYPSWWLYLAGWQRAAIRLTSVYLLAVTVLVVLVNLVVPDPGVLGWDWVLVGHGVLALVVLGPIVGVRRVRDYGASVPVPVLAWRRGPRVDAWVRWEVQGRKTWDLTWVRPLALALDGVLGTAHRAENASRWVHVPRNFRDPDGDPVEVLLPAGFTPDRGVQDRLVRTAGARLGLVDLSAEWSLAGAAPRVLLSAPPEPPRSVSFADVYALLDRAEEYRPLMGLAGSGVAVYAEMIEDSPHIGLSAGPGAGKSTLAKLVAMQALRWGWGLVIVDWKMTKAYEWARDLPGVLYLTELEAIHDFGERIGQEIDLRKRSGLIGRAKVLVIRDEWNVTADLLMAYWQDLRSTADPEEKRSMPVKSPALRGFGMLDFAGREFGVHDFVIAQRMSARVFNGNADIRECFAIRCLARYSEQTKKMLVGNVKPFPRKSNIPGRWTIVAGEDISVVQVPLIQNDEAREFAMGGLPNPHTPLSSVHFPDLMQRDTPAAGLGETLNHDATTALAASESEPIIGLTAMDARKLTDMVEDLAHLGITPAVLRNATQRPEEQFPGPVGGTPNRGYTYDFHAVKVWAQRRHAAHQAERDVK